MLYIMGHIKVYIQVYTGYGRQTLLQYITHNQFNHMSFCKWLCTEAYAWWQWWDRNPCLWFYMTMTQKNAHTPKNLTFILFFSIYFKKRYKMSSLLTWMGYFAESFLWSSSSLIGNPVTKLHANDGSQQHHPPPQS